MKLTHKNIRKYVETLNGGSDISVELNDEDFEVCIYPVTLGVYNKYNPIVKEFNFSVLKSTQDYKINPDWIGRGIINVVRGSSLTSNPFNPYGFTNDLAPLAFPLDFDQYYQSMTQLQSAQSIMASPFDFDYNPDSNTLRIYPTPTQGEFGIIETIHDRRLESIEIPLPVSPQTSGNLYDSDGYPITDITGPISLEVIGVPGKMIVDHEGVIRKDGEVCGSFNRKTGAYALTYEVSDATTLRIDICEIRVEDYGWFMDYAAAIAGIILGRKRKRFSTIPGAQQNIDLYTDIGTESSAEKERLETIAQGWSIQWAIPRTY